MPDKYIVETFVVIANLWNRFFIIGIPACYQHIHKCEICYNNICVGLLFPKQLLVHVNKQLGTVKSRDIWLLSKVNKNRATWFNKYG